MEQIDWQSLPKKERKKLKRELEREEVQKKVKTAKLVKWSIIGLLLILGGLGLFWVVRELTKPLPGEKVTDQGRQHVNKAEWEKFSYNSNPPTSGPHDPVWTKAGIYNEPRGDGHLIHSLEHGYVVISYNCSKVTDCDGLKKQLSDLANEKRLRKLIIVPRANLDSAIALSAWGRIDKLDQLNEERISRFIDAYHNHGPEQTME